jgi:large subunit ribosomal protein L7A
MVERLAGKKVVGFKQSIKAIQNGSANAVYLANDAEARLIETIVELCEENSLEVHYVDTMKDLGKLCGIDVGAATAVILKE